MFKSPDVVCDIGEGFGIWEFGSDAALMKHITMANIACGGHAGDPVIMSRTIDMAAAAGVKIGAHPGFPDMMSFGRKAMLLDADEIGALLVYQIGALQGFLRAKELTLNHVFPHGAMYAYLSSDDSIALAAARAIHAVAPGVDVPWPAPTEGAVYAEELAQLGHHIVPMALVDMKYNADGSIMLERGRKRATDIEYTRAQTHSICTRSEIVRNDGTATHIAGIEALLFHSDGPNAVAVAETITATLRQARAELPMS